MRNYLSQKTRRELKFNFLKLRARWLNSRKKNLVPPYPRLHLGCGTRHVQNWLNVDIVNSDWDIDLSSKMPWQNGCFSIIVSQHVVEHMELHTELIPMFKELNRVSSSGAEIWISCPDMESICRSYLESKGKDLLLDRLMRHPGFSLQGAPPQHIVNDLFHQSGEHKNLFDFELLTWSLEEGGFANCCRTSEREFLERFHEFPKRNDDQFSLYVKAYATGGKIS